MYIFSSSMLSDFFGFIECLMGKNYTLILLENNLKSGHCSKVEVMCLWRVNCVVYIYIYF